MQGLMENNQAEYTFEFPQEVQQRMDQASDLHELIPESAVADLEYVDISHRPYRVVKRLFDLTLSGIGLLILLIPFLIITAAIYADDHGKIFFSQYRVGRNGKRFRMYKFRTMRTDTPQYLPTMEMSNPDSHITKVGRFLRATSLDELPQLLNVLRGDMSLVGPRPLISDEYEIHQMRMRFGVYNIRPGITGLAQINGRDMVSPAEKVRWDVRYLQMFGLRTDLRILMGTMPRLSGDITVVEGGCADREEHSCADSVRK